MTLSIAEGKAIVATPAKKSGKLVMVGSQNKTSTLTATAREIVKSGVLGKVNMVRLATYRNNRRKAPGSTRSPPDGISQDYRLGALAWDRRRNTNSSLTRFFRWRCFWEYSGGVATDLWVHEADHHARNHGREGAQVGRRRRGGIYRFDDGRTRCPTS